MRKESSLEKISAIIPTYNRSPSNKNISRSPLWWAANSLFKQGNVNEIIFIDDCSQDYCSETVEVIKKTAPENIEIKYLKNNERKGSGESRNIGVKVSKNNQLFFMDDDCVIVDSGVLPKLQYAFEYLQQKGISVGAMNLPVSGNSLESEIVESKKIGKANRETGILEGCYIKFPSEYEKNIEEFLINKKQGIFQPLNVEFMGGVFIADKEEYLKAGGFPTTKWKNGYNEEPELMFNLQKNGNEIFYLPSKDPSFRVFHCRYGDPEFERIPYDVFVDGVHFNDILKWSAKERVGGHGNRVSKKDYLVSKILGDMRILSKFYDIGLMEKNLETYHNLNNSTPEGLDIFREGLSKGLNMIRKDNLISEEYESKLREKYLNEN